MFFEFINESTIKKAPRPLKIDGNDVFTNSEEIHNAQGYYKLKETEYPQDEKIYKPTYTLGKRYINQKWVEVEQEESEV